ncbi:conserved protein of unknown function [Modestobacter italicus]|uniref:PLD phosphodiesterase domain-containing protein n=2 Tax=Modestobacter italicus (strain DSM 44449 / CECT 9708 / BC 501) TaxID=2732864 RepID=I4F1L1_MODI5|nr:conserved protein of unknown function [Modestobacter marinus]
MGAELVQAVGTTFTVDLATALAVPLSFASRDLGSVPDPIGVMEAVRSTADRIDVFYQAGQAAVPPQASDVLAFLEPVLHPVTASRAGHLFHPKLWLIKFQDVEKNVSYRLVCMTRNLTGDRSWDAVISLDGGPGPRREAGNQPLSDLISALPRLCTTRLPDERQQRIEAFAAEIRRAVWELPDDVKEIAFHALGVSRRATPPDYSGYRRLVVSPFVDEEGLAIVAPQTRDGGFLVSRPEHLDRLPELPNDLHPKVVSVLAEFEDERAAGELGGLHAKIVAVERARLTHLFIGSANATRAAFDGNVEFVVELVLGAAKYSVDSYLSSDTGLGALLEDYTPQTRPEDPEEKQRAVLRSRLRQLAELPWTMQIGQPAETTYDLRLRSGKPLSDWAHDLSMELLSRRGEAVRPQPGQEADETFTRVELADITPFLVATLREGDVAESSVIPAGLIGDPEDRLDAVLARQVDTPEKFLRFVLLLLSLTGQLAQAPAAGSSTGSWASTAAQGVFELLARALADEPSVLDDLERIVDRLGRTEAGRAVMPEGFADVWATIQEARGLMGART